MECYDDRIELDAFKDKTTYNNDYKWYCHARKSFTGWEKERIEKPSPPSAPEDFKDHETYSSWRKGVHIPFNLLHRPKAIVQTNPRAPFEVLVMPPDDKKEEAIRTRPRVYMEPAVSIDDVPDPQMRQLLCNRMYTTEWRSAEREAAQPVSNPCAPNKISEQTNPVQYKLELEKTVPVKYRNFCKEWDNFQSRALVDPTKTFWASKDPPVVCGACVDPLKYILPQETKDTIAQLIKEEKLRQPHDKPIYTYAGYKPVAPVGLPLRKQDFPAVHPMLTMSGAVTSFATGNINK